MSSYRLQNGFSYIAALLAEIEQEKELEFRAEVDSRMKAMDAGNKVIMEQFEARHQALTERK